MDNKQYEKTIAKLQSKTDLLEAELFYLNKILIEAEFDHGIATLKEAALEVLSEITTDPEEAHIFKKRPESY